MFLAPHHAAALHHASQDARTTPAAHVQTAAVTVPGRYTIRPGDTLSQLAKRFYGHADRWPALWFTNRHEIANPNSIAVGQQIELTSWHPNDPALLAKALRHVPRPRPVHRAVLASSPAGAAVPAPAAPADPVSAQPTSSFQACVIRAESGGNADAQNPTSTASGLYGFLSSTWTAVTGLPGPARAYSVAQQTAAFWKLYSEAGTSPWAAYDGC